MKCEKSTCSNAPRPRRAAGAVDLSRPRHRERNMK